MSITKSLPPAIGDSDVQWYMYLCAPVSAVLRLTPGSGCGVTLFYHVSLESLKVPLPLPSSSMNVSQGLSLAGV